MAWKCMEIGGKGRIGMYKVKMFIICFIHFSFKAFNMLSFRSLDLKMRPGQYKPNLDVVRPKLEPLGGRFEALYVHFMRL